jgi:ATP-dependent RNA helicase SUPV3L1/SUV3
LIRRQRGGAAVVLGALSPRTRNAQVDLYQSGDVDLIVATDAIGMGLNLDVDHVVFASDRKFDGYQYRRLSPAELAQIAGRAGRATRDGTFGTTGRCPPFEPELIERLEGHSFEPLPVLQWRNSDLDFRSISALVDSLTKPPREEGLTRAPAADDLRVLERAANDEDLAKLAQTPVAVERLWEVCQVPDYRKISIATHAELVLILYGFLMREGRIPADWFARQVALADRTDGDIDTLSNRIAQVRTWTFVANRSDWLKDPEHWQDVTRGVEDKLSDALHERLAQRFVDRRTSVLMRRLRESAMLEMEITKTGDVIVEGHVIGHLHGFEFAPDTTGSGQNAKALRMAAQKALAGELEERAKRLADASDDQFLLASDGAIRWIGEAVARLLPGDNVLEPRLRVLADEQLNGAARESVEARLSLWLKSHIEKLLGPLIALGKAEDVTGISRGIAFQLVEALGVLERTKVAEEVKSLDQATRATLRKYGVRFGAYHIYLPALLKPAPRTLGLSLWALKHGGLGQTGLNDLPALAMSGRTSIPVDPATAKTLYRAVGYRVCGTRAIRVDILERLADLIRPALSWRPGMVGEKPAGALDGKGFVVTVAMTSLVGCAGEDFVSILRSLSYRMERRPPPEPAVQSASATETQPASAPETQSAEAPSEAVDGASAVTNTDAPEFVPAPEKSPVQEIAVTESEATAVEDPSLALAETPLSTSSSVSASAEATKAKPTAPVLIEVWRPGRPEGARRPPRRRKEERRKDDQRKPSVDGVAPVEAKSLDTPAIETKRTERSARRDGRRRGQPREDRPRPDRDDRPQPKPRHQRPHERPHEKPIDPNSPFAALLELKARLEASAKDKS